MGNAISQALANVAGKTNAEYWDLARRFSPDFKSHTAKKTAAEFNEKGYEAITLTGTNILNEFFEISMRVAFQLLNVSRARNPFVDKGLIQVYDTPNGGYVQRLSVNSIKPVSPAYLDLVEGGSIDPFVVRKPEIAERFFQMNFDYQNIITVQEYQLKTMFINEYGMGELLAGILEGMANGYTIQEYLNAKECLNGAINSTKFPVKETQVVTLETWNDSDPSQYELQKFILAIKDTATRMNVVTQTGMYNALGFESVVAPEDMVLVLRAGIKNAMNVNLMVGSFNPEFLSLPFEIIEVDDFGGIEHYADAEFSRPVYPVYDKLGAQIGWSETENSSVADVTTIYKKDPNEGVLGVLVQKGAIFENAQNPYTVTPIYNPRGLYTNYIANRPKNGINFDSLYNMVLFVKPQA